jgi:hypothetical protein
MSKPAHMVTVCKCVRLSYAIHRLLTRLTYLHTLTTDVSMRAGQGQERRDFVKSTLGKSTCP